jgi:hypothetical protein
MTESGVLRTQLDPARLAVKSLDGACGKCASALADELRFICGADKSVEVLMDWPES